MKPPTLVTVPPAVVTSTFCEPSVPAGVTAVIEVALLTTTLEAGFPATRTVAPVKLVPVMVIVVPPAAEPELGVIVVNVGAAT